MVENATLTSPKALVFDWDNTLIDSWTTIHAALHETFVAMGHEPWTMERVKRDVRRSWREAFPPLFGDRWEEAGAVFYEAYGRLHIESLAPLPGAADLLAALAGRGYCLAVVSNKRGPFLKEESETLGWTKYFHRLVGAGDAAVDKPAPDPLYMALDGSGHTPSPAVWMVGDADVDLEMAHRAGCTAVLIGEGGPGFEDFPPHLRVSSCADLAEAVRALE